MKKSGGTEQSAYPGWSQHEIGGEIYREPTPGLTKREDFAKAAMQGLISFYGNTILHKTCAVESVKHADALLAELAK